MIWETHAQIWPPNHYYIPKEAYCGVSIPKWSIEGSILPIIKSGHSGDKFGAFWTILKIKDLIKKFDHRKNLSQK